MLFSPSPRRRGLTLVEVVAAIAILGTLLVGVLSAKSRFTRQFRDAQRREQAVRAADVLLESWWADVKHFPRNDHGVVENQPTLRWQTETRDDPQCRLLLAQVVRLTIQDTASPIPGADTDRAALVVVDLLVPLPEPVEGMQ